jgi:GT2 family glycosyltransferase
MQASVIIPTWNRRDALLETLSALAATDYPANEWEAVVIDDGSTDGTDEAVKEWIERIGAPVRYLCQQNAGAAAARNRGAYAARGEILIFIDNDILVPPDFIQQHLQVLRENPNCWILGRIVHPPEMRKFPFGRYRDDFHESFFRALKSCSLTETDGMSAANVSLPKGDFIALRGFDESFPGASCEDWELAMRARQRGIRVLFAPHISVLHNDWAVSLEQFCRRQKLYSLPQVLLWKKYGEASPWAQLVCENSPVNWSEDSLSVILKKVVKRTLAHDNGERAVQTICRAIERCVPDTRFSHQAYNLAVALAIFRGVREGLKRYGAEFSSATPATESPKVQDQTV